MVEMIIITIYYSKIHGEMTNAALYCIATVSLHLQIISKHAQAIFIQHLSIFLQKYLMMSWKIDVWEVTLGGEMVSELRSWMIG